MYNKMGEGVIGQCKVIIPAKGSRLWPGSDKTQPQENSMKVSTFTYTDYRKFLIDCFETKKAENSDFNYFYICKETGIKSPGHLSLILHGKVNIDDDLAKKFAVLCNLKKRETSYFLTMVKFNQEKKHTEKAELFNVLIAFRESSIYRVGPHLYKFYDKWYHSVVRSLVEFYNVDDDFTGLARMVVPAIRPDQAKGSISLLEELGLVARDAEGFFRPTLKNIDTGAGATSITLNNFMLSMINLAREAMDRFPRDKRVFSSVTLGVNRDGYEEILEELRGFRRRAAEIAQKNPADKVVQVNFQMFPVSKSTENKRKHVS
jgi:uncharacterized protein (TIGR02147 family)